MTTDRHGLDELSQELGGARGALDDPLGSGPARQAVQATLP